MPKKCMPYIIVITVILGLLAVAGCSQEDAMTKPQLAVLNKILSDPVTNKQIQTVEIKTEAAQKFPAVDKMFKVTTDKEESYAFVVSPVGYRAPITTMVVIDADKNEIMGIKVMQQDETPGWGEWLAETWFTDRFKGKSVNKYLERAILEAKEDNEIIQITSATVSTQAVLNGVNSAMGLYREVIMGEEAESVSLKVEEFITESE